MEAAHSLGEFALGPFARLTAMAIVGVAAFSFAWLLMVEPDTEDAGYESDNRPPRDGWVPRLMRRVRRDGHRRRHAGKVGLVVLLALMLVLNVVFGYRPAGPDGGRRHRDDPAEYGSRSVAAIDQRYPERADNAAFRPTRAPAGCRTGAPPHSEPPATVTSTFAALKL